MLQAHSPRRKLERSLEAPGFGCTTQKLAVQVQVQE